MKDILDFSGLNFLYDPREEKEDYLKNSPTFNVRTKTNQER